MQMTASYNTAARGSSTAAADAAQKLSNAQQVLSSGKRTVNPAADPASAAVGATLQSDILVFQQLIRNVSNALSVLNLMQGAMRNVNKLLTQMQAMSVQGQDQTLTAQLGSIDSAYTALKSQIANIGDQTQYLGTSLFGSDASFTFVIGTGVGQTLTTTAIDLSSLGALSSSVDSAGSAESAFSTLAEDLVVMSTNIATIAAVQTQLQAVIDQLGAQLSAESQALDTTEGADINDTVNDATTFSVQLQISQAMIESALEQQKALASFVRSVSK